MDLRLVRRQARSIAKFQTSTGLLVFAFFGACIFTFKAPFRQHQATSSLAHDGVSSGGSCRGWFSLTRAVNRANGDDEEPCVTPQLTDEDARDCFQRRSGALGRPVRIALIGDSRARVVFESLARTFKFDWYRKFKLRYSGQYLPEASPQELCSLPACSHHVANNVVDISLEWHLFMNKYTLSTIANVSRSCERPDRGGCPDLVVVNSALWYSSRCPGLRPLRHEVITLMYRLHMQEAVPTLRRVSRLVPTYWTLDELVFSDFARDYTTDQRRMSLENKQQLVAQAVALELSAQVPAMRVWSSQLPTISTAVYGTCAAPLPDPRWRRVPQTCVLKDAVHVKEPFQRKLVKPFLRDICDAMQ